MRSVVVALGALACGGGGSEEEDPLEHACELLAEEGETVAASDDPMTAQPIAIGDSPYTVELVDGGAGWIGFEVSEETAALLFVDTADVIGRLRHDGEEEELPTPAPNESCPDRIPEHFDLDLHPGTWHLGVGPAGIDRIRALLTRAEGHAH